MDKIDIEKVEDHVRILKNSLRDFKKNVNAITPEEKRAMGFVLEIESIADSKIPDAQKEIKIQKIISKLAGK